MKSNFNKKPVTKYSRLPDTISEEHQPTSVVGDIAGSSISIGDDNIISLQVRQASLSSPETIDTHRKLNARAEILIKFNDPIATAIA